MEERIEPSSRKPRVLREALYVGVLLPENRAGKAISRLKLTLNHTVTTADTSDTFDTVASGEAGASTDVVDACSTAPDVVVVPPLRKKKKRDKTR